MDLKEKKRKLMGKLFGKAHNTLENLITKASKVPNTPFFDSDIFKWSKHLEKKQPIIKEELTNILRYKEHIPSFQEISPNQKYLTQDDKWKTFFLYGFGFKLERNCARCPETTKLIKTIPGMKTAFFSILAPGKHIPEHRGLYNGFIRYHLGVKIPQPSTNCGLKVAGEVRHWQEGKSMIFDDTYLHEAWNNSNEFRVVLFMDILRPLYFPVNLISNQAINLFKRSSFIQKAKKNQEFWEEKFSGKIPK